VPLQIVQTTATPAKAGEIMGRNGFLVLSALMTKPSFVGLLSMGIHAGTSYYDCSPPFVSDMQRILDGYSGGRIQFSTPFLSWSRGEILEFCKERNVPLELTWSCEANSHIACGHCMSCRDKAIVNVGTTL
jgi:7-cyano-7-deazaguanine synthase